MSIHYKEFAQGLLINRDFEGLKDWLKSSSRASRMLLSLTFDGDRLIRWRAIEGMGVLAQMLAEDDLDKVRDILRRLFWSMNDESGGLGWHAPDVIGQILVNVPELIDEYGTMLSSFIIEEPFERGTHRAISRIARLKHEPFELAAEHFTHSLEDVDPVIRAMAGVILIKLGQKPENGQIKKLIEDETPLSLYNFEKGDFDEFKVRDLIEAEIG